MREILEQTRLLGEAIRRSEVYQRVQEADKAMNRDPETQRIMNAYQARKAELSCLLNEDADQDELAEAGRALEAAEQALNSAPLVLEAQEASKAYSEMMNQVNQLLSFLLTGTSGSACSGNCSSCGGCH